MIQGEGLTQGEFACELGVSRRSVERYVAGDSIPSGEFYEKLAKHVTFSKYTMWLLTDDVQPQSGQICPAFSTQDTQGSVKKKAY
ncbi:helix-turn-helix domain-containing protein [Shewanella sp. D64]|nr:helix-turn-helix domain-containing protein [Shewanella sp. D64]MEC4740904.1 helix-turn-helix domain-containing protein [Shewanella sp. E94]